MRGKKLTTILKGSRKTFSANDKTKTVTGYFNKKSKTSIKVTRYKKTGNKKVEVTSFIKRGSRKRKHPTLKGRYIRD